MPKKIYNMHSVILLDDDNLIVEAWGDPDEIFKCYLPHPDLKMIQYKGCEGMTMWEICKLYSVDQKPTLCDEGKFKSTVEYNAHKWDFYKHVW